MSATERFTRRLERTQALCNEKLGSTNPKVVVQALDTLEEVGETLSWLPRPSSPATGTAGQASLRMARGNRR